MSVFLSPLLCICLSFSRSSWWRGGCRSGPICWWYLEVSQLLFKAQRRGPKCCNVGNNLTANRWCRLGFMLWAVEGISYQVLREDFLCLLAGIFVSSQISSNTWSFYSRSGDTYPAVHMSISYPWRKLVKPIGPVQGHCCPWCGTASLHWTFPKVSTTGTMVNKESTLQLLFWPGHLFVLTRPLPVYGHNQWITHAFPSHPQWSC